MNVPARRASTIGLLAALLALQSLAQAPLPPATATPPPPTVLPAREAYINFSFDQVGIATFARLVGELTGKRIVVSDDVQGKLTVISPKIRREEAYGLFVSILESAGCSVIQDGDVYRIVMLSERASPMAPVVGVGEAIPDDGVITKVFHLVNVSASDVRRLLEPKVRGGKVGAVGVIEDTNHLVVTDTAESIRRIEKIVTEIDRPGLARLTEVVTLQYASAEDVARELSETLAESDSRGEELRRRLPAATETSQTSGTHLPVVVASAHSNSLLLVGTSGQIQELKRIIAMMDVDMPSGRGRLNAIFLKYIQADEAATNLKALLSRRDVNPAGQTPGAATRSRRDIAIEPSPANNALLVDASPGDFEVVKKLVDQLDQVPQQVHIEVLIAELTEGENLNLGVSMAAMDTPGKKGDYAVQGSSTLDDNTESLMNAVQNGIFPGGLTLGVAHGSAVDASGNVVVGYPGILSINAIKKDTRLKIRSNPSLMAQDNHEASVNIVDEIPIQTSTVSAGTGTSRDVIQNIQRVDVGIKLKLKPHVIPGGEVRMVLNPSIEAVSDAGPSGQFAPTIAKREVSTTVTVKDGDVIVIAGLTRENQVKTVKRIPILGSIPLIGWLFRNTSDGTERSNLLVFVTPKIVSSGAVAAGIRDEAMRRTGLSDHDDSK